MGRTARRPGPPSFLFGVWGEGETTPENIEALLSEFIEGLGDVTPRFLIPLDKELTTDTIIDVANWALDNKYAVEVVEAAPVRTKDLRAIKAEAEKIHEADDKDNSIEVVFAAALGAKAPDDARLLFLWAEENGEPIENDQRVLFDCIDAGVTALDLTQGLDVLGTEGEDGGAAEAPDEDTVRGWPIRRVREHALDVAADMRKEKKRGVPKDDVIEEWGKDELLEFLYPDSGGDAEPEPDEKPKGRSRRGAKADDEEPPADDEEPPADDGDGKVTSISARRKREAAEAAGEDTLAGTKSRQRSARKEAEAAPEPPEDTGAGEDTGETPVERLGDALAAWGTALVDNDDTGADEAFVDFADALADVIIDRIAARVEKEPENSAVRKEVAPPRPPGKPRNDGETPRRRRTRA